MHAAVTAALADGVVDDHPARDLGRLAFLAPAPQLSGTGLLVNNDRGSLVASEFPLQRVVVIPVMQAVAWNLSELTRESLWIV